ncbi:MAG: hypothetical protein AAGN46_13780 [Acidobacteriota bacterium]
MIERPPARPWLGGIELDVQPDTVQRRDAPRRTLVRTGRGAATTEHTLAPEGEPVRLAWRTFTIDWGHLAAAARQQVGHLLAPCRALDLVTWHDEHELAWIGTGERRAFRWPNGWRVATDLATPSGGLAPARFAPALYLGAGHLVTGAEVDPMPAAGVDDATYDGGDPDPGEMWWRLGGSHFKLGTAPAAGEVLVASMVPAYRVLEDAAPQDRALQRPLPEPYRLVLQEARRLEGAA